MTYRDEIQTFQFPYFKNYKIMKKIHLFTITVTVHPQIAGAEYCLQVCASISPATLNQSCL